MSIKNELSELESVNFVEGSPEDKPVTIEWDAPSNLEKIKEKLKEINYPGK